MLYAAPDQYEGRTISSIRFDPSEQPLDPAELHELLPLVEGSALRLVDVQKTIERLFATGRYEDITVDADLQGTGVGITIVTKHSWFIGHVSAEGNISDPPNPGQIVNASRLSLGDPFQPDAVKKAEENIRHLLVSNGLYESAVTSHIDYTDIAQQVNIRFLVSPGKRARFTTPLLTGDLQLPANQIIKATKWKSWISRRWQPITQTRVRQGLESARAKFEKSDRLLATVDLKSLVYDPNTRRATPTLEVNAGPKVSIKAVGAKVKRKDLVNNVPIYEEHTVDQDLLEEGKRNLREAFQAKGYFDAEVEFQSQRVIKGKQEIDYIINPGERHAFVKLDIVGNKYFTIDAIRERMFLQPKSLQFRRGRYSEAFVRRDEESITNLYKSNGFRDVTVTATDQDDYLGKAGNIALELKIIEGPQYIVSKLDITGASKLDLKNVVPTLSSAEDQPYSDFNVAADRDTIISYYYEHGFPAATFQYTVRPGVQPNMVELHFILSEGKQQFVRDVITSGLRTTKPNLVDRNILLDHGDPLSPVQMAETQRRLYDLGVFAKVDMAIQNQDGDTQRKYVVYDMEEARRYSLTFGFGAQIANIGGSNAQASLANPAGKAGFSPRVSADLTRINFLGKGHTVSFRSRYSSLDTRALVDYLAPKIFDHDKLDVNFTALYDNARDVRTFSAKRREGSVQLTERHSKPTTIFYRYTYRDVRVGTLKIDPLLIPRLSQSVRIGILSATIIQDRRDDPTDAHKGIYNTVDLGFASKYYGSQATFLRLLARNATYHRVGKKIVFARETSFGVQPAFALPRDADPTDPIPLPERFFGGGGSSHRGFPENQAGPRDLKTGFPLGGSALFFNNLELRYPILGENIGGVVFHDMGNIFDKINNLSFRFRQRDLTDFNYVVHAVGTGVRYRTPIGPVRLDLAYSVNSPKFNGFGGTFDQLVACSVANTCVSSQQRVSRFQFFFSIGQTF